MNYDFGVEFEIKGFIQGPTTEYMQADIYVNGFLTDTITVNGTGALTNFDSSFSFDRFFHLGDIVFVAISSHSPSSNLRIYITDAILTATSKTIKAYYLYREQYDTISGIPNLLGNIPGTSKPLTTGPGAPYNIVPFSPKRMALAWMPYVNGCLYHQRGQFLTPTTISKNKYLSTTLAGVTITEFAPIEIGVDCLFLPYYINFLTEVQRNFADLLTGAANAHVHNTYFGVDFYSFPKEMKQNPGTSEAQSWQMLASPQTNILNLVNFQTSGINLLDMPNNSIMWGKASPVQFFSENEVLDPQINTYNRYKFPFIQQVANWINKNNYYQKWQNNDTISLQFITNGLSALVYNLYNCSGILVASNVTIPQVYSFGVAAPYLIFEIDIEINSYATGIYFLEILAGSGGSQAALLSEGLYIASSWPQTVLLKGISSFNTQNIFFDTGYAPQMRVEGILGNMFKRKFKRYSYIDQVQDSKTTQAFPYDVCDFWQGLSDGQPFWVTQKVTDWLLWDGTSIEDEPLGYDGDAEPEETFIPGNPKPYVKHSLRSTKNVFANVATAIGTSDDSSLLVTVDAVSMGPNAGNNTQSTESDIVQILIS